jgi:membrane protease subunit HflC
MKKSIYAILIAGGALIVVTAFLTFFTVSQTQQALVLEFGKPKRVIKDAGLNWKIPFIQNVQFFDKRILDLDATSQEAIASDQKRLVVDAFLRYRIVDPLRFFQTVRDERIARQRLSTILESSLRRVLGESSFIAVVRDKREDLMARITEQVNANAQDFGIDVVDVRIKRADLPEANSQAIFRRMQTEREQEAAQIRAQGEEVARRIRAEADRDVTVLKAKATRQSEVLRGQGDAERNNIFNGAFGKDPDFFGFYRSMQAYEAGLKSTDTRLLLSPNTEFFRYFNDPTGLLMNGKAGQ